MSLKTLATALVDTLKNLPTAKRATLPPRYEPVNVATSARVTDIQGMLRQAEQGDPARLFALYRDQILAGSHIQCEFSKRKLSLLGDTLSILPADKTKPDDVAAAEAVRQAIEDCENWLDGLIFLQDSCLYPVSVVEHIFRAADQPSDQARKIKLRYTLKRFEPVKYPLLCFLFNDQKPLAATERSSRDGGAPDQWEPELKFWSTDEYGAIVRDLAKTYPADPLRHIVHRSHLLIGIPDNWGGPMRSVVFWQLLSQLGRDYFARFMERYGAPFVVGYTDSQNKAAVDFLNDALSLSTKIGGLVVDEATRIELKEAMVSGAADGYEKFLGVCNREISKVIVGQDLSSQSAPTGLGSGVANLQAGVRQDIRMFDSMKLGETLEKQLFTRFLRINGLNGSPPKARWGGLSAEEAKETGALLVSLTQANLEPTDEAISLISERVGFEIQRKEMPAPDPAFPSPDHRAVAGLSAKAGKLQSHLMTLSSQVRVADTLGVPPDWLNPLRDFLETLVEKAADKTLSEQDLLDFLDAAIRRVPELFAHMDVDELARVLETGMGHAVLQAARRGIKQGKFP